MEVAHPPLTVTDVGVGRGITSWVFLQRGYQVTGLSLKETSPTVFAHEKYTHIQENLFDIDLPQADIVWASHVIEHMPNVGLFLEKCRSMTKIGGWFCVVAPSDPTSIIVDGHLTFWTPAHLIYNLVVAGFDCKDDVWHTDGRDIGLMVRRKDRPHIELNYDNGDLPALAAYFPVPIIHRQTNPWLLDRDLYETSNTSQGGHA